MRRSLLGLVALLALLSPTLVARASSPDRGFGPHRIVSPWHVGTTDWASATDAAGDTAYVFRRAHEIDLRIRHRGGRLSRPLVIATATTYPATPQVSLASDGTGAVAWAVPRGSRLAWRVREFDVRGALGVTRSPVSADLWSRDLRAVALTGGRTVVTWTHSASPERGAYVSQLTEKDPKSPVFRIGSAAGSAAPWVMAGLRHATVVWTDGEALVGRRLDPHGLPGPSRELAGGFPRRDLSLSAEATDAAGVGLFVGSVRQHGVNHVFVMRVRPGVRFAQPPTLVSSDAQDVGVNGEVLAVSANATGVVAWSDALSGASYARVLGADGSIGALQRFRSSILAAAVGAHGHPTLLLHAPRHRHPLRLVRLGRGVPAIVEGRLATPRPAYPGGTLAALPHGRLLAGYDAGRGRVLETAGR
jgi:hypothetical protein